MGKVKIRQKGRNKGYRWAKGHSSDSNPPLKKYRRNAQAGFFKPLSETSTGLTAASLGKHDAVLGVSELRTIEQTEHEPEDGEDALSESALTLGSVGAHSFRTFATDFTQCTVPSFSKLLGTVRKDSPVYNEMLAILAAVTEVVRQKGGEESVTEYFCALMSVLESTTEEGVQLEAVCHLLSLCTRHTPRTVLIAKFSLCSKLLMARLEAVMATGTVMLIKSLLECVAHLLRAQSATTWSEPSTMQMYAAVLSFAIHSRPKVRRAGQRAVVSILLGSACQRQDEDAAAHHPAAASTALFCRQQMETCGGTGRAVTTLHVLTLLRAVLVTFPRQQLKLIVETMLKLMTLATPLVKRMCMESLQSMLATGPDRQALPPAMNAQLISALYDYQPAMSDSQALATWLTLMRAAHVTLYTGDHQLGVAHLRRLFAAAAGCWAAQRPEVRAAAADCLTGLLEAVVAELDTADEPTARACFQSVIQGLNLQYVDAWPLVLRTIAKFFQVYGSRGSAFMGAALSNLAELRDSEQFSYTAELESAVGAAVTALGPRALIQNIPLKIAGDAADDVEFPRSWLLPVMRTSVRDTEIAFFADYFLPLARALKARAVELDEAGDRRLSRIYHTLELQVWDLLPGFCTGTTDITDNLKRVARLLGTLLTERDDLRLLVLSALRLLVHKSCDDDASRAAVSRFAKNYLPILFNLYMTLEEPGHRAAVLETVSAYLSLASDELVHTLADKALSQLGAAGVEDQQRARMLDLVRAMLPRLDCGRLTRLWRHAEAYVESDQGHTQKTAYRLLEEICHSEDEGCIAFVQENHVGLMAALKRSLAKATSSAKTSRLACLGSLLDHLDSRQQQFVAGVLPEAVACCKEHNEKTRAAAFKLIIKVGDTLQRWSAEAGGTPGEAMRSYMQLLLAGMTGSPKLIAATLLATAQVIHQFNEVFPVDLLDLTMDNVSLLLTSSSREPAEACMSLVKALVFALDPILFAKYLPKLVKALSLMTPDCKRHFRQKTRDLLSVLVRKFGFDVIFGLAPSADPVLQKRLKNIRKLEQRKKSSREEARRQQADDAAEDEPSVAGAAKTVDDILQAVEASSDEDDEGTQQQQQRASKKPAAWIREDADTIVDLLDPRASRQVVASRPGRAAPMEVQRSRRRRTEFSVSEDGRLVIAGDDEDDDVTGSAGSDDDGDDGDDFAEAIGGNTAGRKRKVDSSSQGTASEAAPVNKYQAGGGGIHRRLGGSSGGSVKSGRSRASTASSRPGAEYSSRKGGGDVKRAGRPDPYAYVPLQRGTLNKRKRAKSEGQYKSIVRGAHKGAAKAANARSRKS